MGTEEKEAKLETREMGEWEGGPGDGMQEAKQEKTA